MNEGMTTISQDATELLIQDHYELKQVMNELEKAIYAEDTDKMEDLFQKFKKVYGLHDDIEDKIFYPALKDFDETHKLILKSYQAHHVVNVGILELRLVPFRSEDWGPKFLVIRDSILTHMEEEESKVFKEAKRLLDRNRLEELGNEILEYKDKKA